MKKNKLTSFFVLLYIGIVLSACSHDVSLPVASCSDEFAAQSALNPKAAAYQAILDKYVQQGIPGVSVWIRTPKAGVWSGASGMSNIEKQEPMQTCHLHHSASVAKMYIAAAVLVLVEQGKLKLDDPVRDYLPEEVYTSIANADVATVRQVLNHSSGIYNFNDNLKLFADSYNTFYQFKSSLDLFEKYVYGQEAYFEAGKGFHYSNTNYSILGMVIEKASGQTLGQFVQAHIIDVAGMKNTYYKANPAYPTPPGMVNSYFEHFEGQLQNCTDLQTHMAGIALGHEGMIASPADFARFIEGVFDARFFSKDLLEQMKTAEADSYYSLGLMRYDKDTTYSVGYGHTGGAFGTATYVIYFPDKPITLVMCTNVGSVFYGKIAETFYIALLDELAKEVFRNE